MSDSIEKYDAVNGNFCPLYIEPAMLAEDDVQAHTADLPAADTEHSDARQDQPADS